MTDQPVPWFGRVLSWQGGTASQLRTTYGGRTHTLARIPRRDIHTGRVLPWSFADHPDVGPSEEIGPLLVAPVEQALELAEAWLLVPAEDRGYRGGTPGLLVTLTGGGAMFVADERVFIMWPNRELGRIDVHPVRRQQHLSRRGPLLGTLTPQFERVSPRPVSYRVTWVPYVCPWADEDERLEELCGDPARMPPRRPGDYRLEGQQSWHDAVRALGAELVRVRT